MGFRGPSCIILPHFSKSGQSFVEILHLLDFSKLRSSAIQHFKSLNAFALWCPETQYASAKQMSSKSEVSEISQFFRFFFTATIVDFNILNFYRLNMSGEPSCSTVPNFVKIGQSIVAMSQFFDFSRWRPWPSTALDLFGAHLDHP